MKVRENIGKKSCYYQLNHWRVVRSLQELHLVAPPCQERAWLLCESLLCFCSMDWHGQAESIKTIFTHINETQFVT